MQEHLSQWQIYPLEGNHDFGQVINSQDFTTTDPIIPILTDYWSAWLSPEAIAKFSEQGYYVETFKTTDGTVYEDVKVLAVNTMPAYNANYFLIAQRDDPGNVLAWLEETLTEMESNGQKGILIGHHPPAGDSTLNGWSKRFQALMDRFQNVVRLSFFGHVHEEKHNVVRSIQNDMPIGVNFWSGAMTTFTFTHPSFRQFVVDAQTMLPIRVETYRLDLTQEEPNFELDHELTEYFDMPDLSPASFDALATQMRSNETLALNY